MVLAQQPSSRGLAYSSAPQSLFTLSHFPFSLYFLSDLFPSSFDRKGPHCSAQLHEFKKVTDDDDNDILKLGKKRGQLTERSLTFIKKKEKQSRAERKKKDHKRRSPSKCVLPTVACEPPGTCLPKRFPINLGTS